MLSSPQPFEKPSGFRDHGPRSMERLRQLERAVLTCMGRWGYVEVRTPTMEYYDTIGIASQTPDEQLFKLLDRWGNAMVLRPEMTSPIARLVGSSFQNAHFPLRFSYHANVFRTMNEEAGRSSEFWQAGAECIGGSSAEADAEMIALAIACLESVGMEQFRLVMGHVGLVDGILRSILPDDEATRMKIKQQLLQYNDVGYTQIVQSLHQSDKNKNRLLSLLTFRGKCTDAVLLQRISEIAQSDDAQIAVQHILEVQRVLRAYGVDQYVHLDLTVLGHWQYYTGITLEGYSSASAFPILTGGRYDQLLDYFGCSFPARGFALQTERLLEVIRLNKKTQEQRVLIVYDRVGRTEALQLATKLRMSTDQVVVVTAMKDDIAEIEDDAYDRTIIVDAETIQQKRTFF